MEILTQEKRDQRLGLRTRRRWAEIVVEGRRRNISEDQIRDYIDLGGLKATDEERRELADRLGIDLTGLIDFLNAIMPIIAQMMAMCGA